MVAAILQVKKLRFGEAKPLAQVTQLTVPAWTCKLSCTVHQRAERPKCDLGLFVSPLWLQFPPPETGLTGGSPSRGGLRELNETIHEEAGTRYPPTHSHCPAWLNAV